MTYHYPRVQGGYRWNMLQRIKNTVGIEPIGSGDAANPLTSQPSTYLDFSRELTVAEKTLLDTVMVSNPTFPPIPAGTVFKIQDIWEKLAQFNQNTGLNFQLYYSDSGEGKIDTIELHAPSTLTTSKKNQVKTAFANLIREA